VQRLTRGLPRLGNGGRGTDLLTAVLLSLLFSPLLMGTLGCFLCSALPSGSGGWLHWVILVYCIRQRSLREGLGTLMMA
jgi:hypothetical protein